MCTQKTYGKSGRRMRRRRRIKEERRVTMMRGRGRRKVKETRWKSNARKVLTQRRKKYE